MAIILDTLEVQGCFELLAFQGLAGQWQPGRRFCLIAPRYSDRDALVVAWVTCYDVGPNAPEFASIPQHQEQGALVECLFDQKLLRPETFAASLHRHPSKASLSCPTEPAQMEAHAFIGLAQK